MLPNLPAIHTRTGRIAEGSSVRPLCQNSALSTAPEAGLVTAVVWTGNSYALQIDGKGRYNPEQVALLSANTYAGFNYVNPNAQWATSGTFEVVLPGEGDRIYFVHTPEQVVTLLAATIGLQEPEREVAFLKRALEAGPLSELRWRGQAVGQLVGQLAYVSSSQQRPRPAFLVGDKVRFSEHGALNTISGVALYKDRLNYGKTRWHYFYAEQKGVHHPLSEDTARAADKEAVGE